MCVCVCMDARAGARDDRADEKYLPDCYFGPFYRESVVTGLDVSNVAAPAEPSGCGGLNVRQPPRCPHTWKPLLSNAPLEGCNCGEGQMRMNPDLAEAAKVNVGRLNLAAEKKLVCCCYLIHQTCLYDCAMLLTCQCCLQCDD